MVDIVLTGIGQTGPHRHDTALGFFDTFDDQYAAMLRSANRWAVYIDQITTFAKFSCLPELRLADVAVQRDKLVFHVYDTKQGVSPPLKKGRQPNKINTKDSTRYIA